MKKVFALAFAAVVLVMSCSKEDPPNPFDNIGDNPNDTLQIDTINPNSLEGIYKNIFLPTCANSGCHDGTFEPDFRTIESSYNTLIFHGIIKNDTSDLLQYRVVPGDANRSMLIRRMIKDLGGNSGIMPLATEPNSDWPAKKDQYIQNMRNWINAGAPDVNGNPATSANTVPQMAGVHTMVSGNTSPLPRNIEGMMLVPTGTSAVDIYFAVQDDQTPATQLGVNEIKVSTSRTLIDASPASVMQIIPSPLNLIGYSGPNVDYYHKHTVAGLDSFQGGQQLFIQIRVADDVNPPVTIPGYNSLEHLKNYFTIEFQ